MSFTAVVSSPCRIGRFSVPSVYGKFSLSTSDDEPVNRVTGHDSANFTSEFLHRCHGFFPLWRTVGFVRIIGNTIPAQRDLAGPQSAMGGLETKLERKGSAGIQSIMTLP